MLCALCDTVGSRDMPRASRAATWETDTEPQDGAFCGAMRLSSPGCSLRASSICMIFQDHRRVCSGAIAERVEPRSRNRRLAFDIILSGLSQAMTWQANLVVAFYR